MDALITYCTHSHLHSRALSEVTSSVALELPPAHGACLVMKEFANPAFF